jgi:iron complex outermembrane receptor protein
VIAPIRQSNFSWKLGVNYKPTPDLLAYASVTTGYKSGTYNGGFLSTDPVQAEVQLQPVAPENNTAYEIGLKSEFLDRRVVFNVAAFYNDYRNLQVFALVPSPNGPLNTLTNAQKVHTYGADIELVAQPFSPLTLRAGIGLLETKVDRFVSQVPGVATICPSSEHLAQLAA